MITKAFSTKSWCPDGQKRTEDWKKFKEDIVARGPSEGSWLKRKAKMLVGR